MKISNLFLTAAIACSITALMAQKTTGSVTYIETIKLQIDLPEGNEEMKKMLPPEQKVTKTLVFNEKSSLYKNAGPGGEGDVDLKTEDEGNDMNIVIKMPQMTHFTDLTTGQWLRAEEFFGRDFLVSGGEKRPNWKLTGEQKKLGDYICQKAVLQDSTMDVAAWFTPQIAVQAGPGQFAGLPGLILELDMDGGNRTVKAIKIDLKPVAETDLAQPTKGKKVTADEFAKIRDEKMKEMGAETGPEHSGGQMRMIIKTENRN